MTKMMVKRETMVRRQENEKSVAIEKASTTIAERAKAMVQAHFLMAMQNPRDMDEVRFKLLRDCQRPVFAKMARYKIRRGAKQTVDGAWVDNYIEGFNVRFAEAALRAMRNIWIEQCVTFEDEQRRIVQVSVTDLETNIPILADVVINKQVERRKLRSGQIAISRRVNADGEQIFLVEATEDDTRLKQNANASRVIRNAVLRLVPTDILEECRDQILETLREEASEDPDLERKRIIDAFAELNVTPANLKLLLKKDLGQCSPEELVELRAVYTAIKEGEARFDDFLDEEAQESVQENVKSRSAQLVGQLKKSRAVAKQRAKIDVPSEKPKPPKRARKKTKKPVPQQVKSQQAKPQQVKPQQAEPQQVKPLVPGTEERSFLEPLPYGEEQQTKPVVPDTKSSNPPHSWVKLGKQQAKPVVLGTKEPVTEAQLDEMAKTRKRIQELLAELFSNQLGMESFIRSATKGQFTTLQEIEDLGWLKIILAQLSERKKAIDQAAALGANHPEGRTK